MSSIENRKAIAARTQPRKPTNFRSAYPSARTTDMTPVAPPQPEPTPVMVDSKPSASTKPNPRANKPVADLAPTPTVSEAAKAPATTEPLGGAEPVVD